MVHLTRFKLPESQRAEDHRFGIRFGNQHVRAKRTGFEHGVRRSLKCNFQGCTYKVMYELTLDKGKYGWCMCSCNTQQSAHPFANSSAEKMTMPLNRTIPEKYVELANTVMDSTVNSRQVYSILCSMAKKIRHQ
jgi:hypothetical protein